MSPTGNNTNIGTRLELYSHDYGYYSHKVLMALYEKKLPFRTHFVNLTRRCQYEPWFLELNPKGEVPVLADHETGVVVPDSSRIIDYLEDKFSNDGRTRLIPTDLGTKIHQKVIHFRTLIDQLPAAIITYGSFYHPQVPHNPKLPFLLPVRSLLKSAEKSGPKRSRLYAKELPRFREALLTKADKLEYQHQIISEFDEYVKILDQVERVLDEVEEELSKHKYDPQEYWLCCDRFTAADISLTVLLERLNQIGLETRYWTVGKRKYVEQYYERVQKRYSYKKTMPTAKTHVQMFMKAYVPMFN